MAQQEFPIQRESLVRIIRAFGTIGCNDSSENLPTVEAAGSLLWDLSADPDAIGALLQSGVIDAVVKQLDGCSGRTAWEVIYDDETSVGRALELCFGILANLYAFPEAVRQLVADKAVLLRLLHTLITLDDPPALSETCRMLATAVSSSEGCIAWMPLLMREQQVLPHLMLLIQTTLNAQLLHRSLGLVAALLPASTPAATAEGTLSGNTAEAPVAEPGSHLGLQLWESGLADTILAVLVPAAAHATAASVEAQPGGWDDGAEAAGDSSSIQQVEQRLYKQPEVLEALVSVLQQLAVQPDGVYTAVQYIPQLPRLMLQLMASCSLRGDQEALELLLPVLVEYRTAILPLLQQQLQPPAHQDPTTDQRTEDGQQQGHGLQYLVCIAAALQDSSSPDSLDALDAGWYLCAAATRDLPLHKQLQAEDSRAAGSSPQQAQQQAAVTPHDWIASTVSECQLLMQICSSLGLVRVPPTAVIYAVQYVQNVMKAIATIAANRGATIEARDKFSVQAVLPSVQQTLVYLGQILQTVQDVLQEQQAPGDGDQGVQRHLADIQQLQRDVGELQKALEDS